MVVPSTSSAPPAGDKARLRAELRARRRDFAASLAPETRIALEEALAAVLEPLLFAARVVAAYQPMKDEISPLGALARARALGKQTALPAFAARDSRMTFRGGEASQAGPWGLLQPPLTAPPLQPDLILIPLVGCDGNGNRIGMGQGHYDRALEGLRESARLVGIGWDFQLLDEAISADPWDQRLDAFASPAGLREFEAG
jgi:5-formyltetrahydrofolate cyclo-ligase